MSNTKTTAKKSLVSIVRTLDDRYLKALAKVCSDAGDFDGEILAYRALRGSLKGSSNAKIEIARTIQARNWYGPDAVKCVSDAWDADGSVPYDDVDSFRAMCQEVFGEAPALSYRDERWYGGDGVLILVSLVVDQAAGG